MSTHQAQPITVEDQVAIAQLLARYARCLDSGDVDGYVDLFAPDGALDGQAGPRFGHAAIRRVAEAMAAAAASDGPARGQRHVAGAPTIEGDHDRCEARSYFLLMRQTPQGDAFVQATGEYIDTCIRRDDGWVFARREIRLLLGRFGA
jgi:3-phenylpropionate/cinnamic acid dioxygenase small subunit